MWCRQSAGLLSPGQSRALTQVEIYHFNNLTTVDSIATIALYKDLTTHVALSTIRRSKGEQGAQHVIGKVEFKVVYDVSPFNLRDITDLMRFAEVFIATLRFVLV